MKARIPPPTPSFYVVGGTLRRDAACYVQRKADLDLFDNLMAGRFCYVLTPRQMGKSSLMIRTAARLREEGAGVVVLDLTAAGQNLTIEQWYGGLLMQMGQQLDLEDELLDFWQNRSVLSPLQRWMTAMREIVLPCYLDRLVVFVDEIDAVLSLPFKIDEFFAGIREFYNRRTQDEELERLTFCLLGVATPSDLIRDTRTTPFNIGRRIELHDFTPEEARPLAQGLNRADQLNERLLNRILFWTNGHPYLTQRLCQTIADNPRIAAERDIDDICEELFLSSRARERDDNLLFVRERLLRSEVDLAALLELYARVHRRAALRDDETNPLFSVLQLSGVTRVERGALVVRNRLYWRAFDQAWIKSNMPDAEVRRQKAAFRRGVFRASILFLFILIVIATFALFAIQQRNIAKEQAAANRSLLYASEMNLAGQAWASANITHLAQILERHRPAPGQEDLRGFEWSYYKRLINRDLATLPHPNLLLSVAFSPDGQLLAVSDKNGFIYLWELASRRRLAQFRAHEQEVWRIVFSPDGTKLASASWDNTVKLWEVKTGHELFVFKSHQGRVCGLAFSPDGRKLATGSWDQTVKLFEVSTGKELMTLIGHSNWVWAIAFSPDGQKLASASEDKTIKLWEVKTGGELMTLNGHHGSVYTVGFSPDGSRLASGGTGGEIIIWDGQTGLGLTLLRGHSFTVNSVTFSSDGRKLTSAGVDRVIRIWDLESLTEMTRLKGHTDEIRALAFSADSGMLATCGDDRTVKLWRTPVNEKPETLTHSEDQVDALSFSPDGITIASANKAWIVFWNVSRGDNLGRIETKSPIYDLSYSPDGQTLAVAHRDSTITLWDTQSRLQKGALKGHADIVFNLCYSPDGRWLASGGRDHLVKIWDAHNLTEAATLRGHEWGVKVVAFSPDGGFLATGSDDRKIIIWDLASQTPVRTLTGHAHEVWAATFSADGQRLASSGYDRNIKVWDWRRGKEVFTLRGHSAGVKALAFSPDGKRLASGGEDRIIKLWELTTGVELANLYGHTAVVTALGFSPDGLTLASSARDRTARQWIAAANR